MIILSAIAIVTPPQLPAEVATSTDYSFEYAASTAAGGTGTTTDYETISRVQTKGFAVSNAGATDYSFEPVVGSGSSPSARVADWDLY